MLCNTAVVLHTQPVNDILQWYSMTYSMPHAYELHYQSLALLCICVHYYAQLNI